MIRKLKIILVCVSASLATHTQFGKSYLPHGEEVRFSYTAEFITSSEDNRDALAEFHITHLFGVFQSPEYSEKYDIDTQYAEGFGALKLPIGPMWANESVTDNGKRKIRYTANGLMLLHNKVAETALQAKHFKVHLPYDLDAAYKEYCTDPKYTAPDQYWYFNNLYREGCTDFQAMPHSQEVNIHIFSTRNHLDGLDPRFDLLRGDNDNGDLFSIYIIHGFDESTSRRDNGRRNFNALTKYLKRNGFKKQVERRHFRRPYYIFTDSLKLDDASVIKVEIHSVLVDTDIETRGTTFAEFLQKAFNEADVLVYMGHSGMGGNLDIPTLEDEVGRFSFNKNKQQIFFFNTCFSYSHYLAPFERLKSNKKLAVLTNGLAKLFATSSPVLEKFLEALLDPKVEDHTWQEILESMEAPLDGGSYLLNVSGL